MHNKADQAYWQTQYAGYRFHIAKPRDIVRRWIEAYVPEARSDEQTCLEIGCYPGRYSAVFGELGYRLYGIDLIDALDALPAWLQSCGYRTGTFRRQDFCSFDTGRRFDLVCSFGFIEHFTDWEVILEKHLSLVADRGFLVVEAPNFTGTFQHWLHSRLDAENLARHHLPAMQVERWADIIADAGFDIIYCGYFGPFRFWTEPQPRTLAQRALLRALRLLQPVLRHLLPPHRKAYSPFAGVIAQRTGGRC